MPSARESMRLLVASSPVFSSTLTSRISLCIRSSSLKIKAKGSALYTISSFFSTSGAIVTSYFRGLPDVKKNKKGFTPLKDESLTGFTLIEVIVALLVLLLVFLALMQTALVGIESNVKNVLRDEAVSIAEERMSKARNLLFAETFDKLLSDSDYSDVNPDPADPYPSNVTFSSGDCPADFPAKGKLIERSIRNITNFNFCTNRTVSTVGTNNKQVTITIGWWWKGVPYTHSIMTMMRRQ